MGTNAAKRGETREQVRVGIEEGYTITEIAHGIGVSAPTVCYHARRLGYAPSSKLARRYDWAAIQAFHHSGHTQRECRARFGFSHTAGIAAIRRGELRPREHVIPLESLLVDDRPTQRGYLKRRILRAGLRENRCERCGLVEWQGAEIAFGLHHVNGRKHDNRLENLQLLCPNCHSQTENFAGRNRGGGTTRRRSSVAVDVEPAGRA